MATKKLRTPIVKPRTQGGTFYTFSSALEDIGLNINELNNKVVLSHYVILDIPPFNFEGMERYGSEEDNYNQGDYKFAESFQNYALNMETVLRNQDTYNFAESLTVSERVFWKYMQEIGLMSFKKDDEEDENNPYYVDDTNIVKGFGLINAGAQRTDAYGIYNETFVQIPSSYGQMKVLFKPVSDKNYHITDEDEQYAASNDKGFIENLDESDYNKETDLLYTGIPAKAQYDGNEGGFGVYNVTKQTDELCIEFSIDNLRDYYKKETLTFDDLGIECMGMDSSLNAASYNFNAILVYYSIYDSTGKNILATNLYGILILNSAVPYQDLTTIDSGSQYYIFPQLEKKQTTNTTSGSSYAFRLNVKASSIYSGNVVVNDESTAAYEMTVEFNDVLRNLSVAIETLKSNANVIAKISTTNKEIKNFAASALDKVAGLEKDIAALKTGAGRNIIAESLSTDNLSVNTLFIPVDGLEIITNVAEDKIDSSVSANGRIDNDKFYYKTINANTVTSANITSSNTTTSQLSSPLGGMVLMEGNDQCGKINNTGIFTHGNYYVKNNAGSPNNAPIADSDVEAILTKSNIYLDSSLGYYMTLPNSDEYGISDAVLKSLYEKSSGFSEENLEYYNLTSLVMLLLHGYKTLYNKVNS